MGGSTTSRRAPRRRASMIATVGLVAGLLSATAATSAFAAGPLGCLINGATGNGTTGSGLQVAINGAGSGCGGYRAGHWVTSLTPGGAPNGSSGPLGGGYRAGHWVASLTPGGAPNGGSGPLGGGYRAGHWVP